MAADPRTIQANERTLLAWVRTGISLITFGFAIAKLGKWLGDNGRTAAPGHVDVAGAAFVLLGAVGVIFALARFVRVRSALVADRPVPTGAGSLVVIVVLVAAIGLWLGAQLILL
jgi:putative membrane protein